MYFQILGSAYLLHANEQHLERIFEVESEELDKWRDSPGEISRHDWRDYLGNRQLVTATSKTPPLALLTLN
jgi:hypothetical protein